MTLHLTKIAFGCDSLSYLQERLAARGRDSTDGRMRLTTRYRPTRHAETLGGSLYWIIAHHIVARSPIIGFEDTEDGRTAIVLEAVAIPVQPKPKRAHQGWRYLSAADAPSDFAGDADDIAALPGKVLKELSKLALV